MTQKTQPNYTFALTVVIIVCFLIGFVTTMNNSMIGFCKTVFNLTEAQGQLVNSAFYGAYALSIPFALMMNKIGYKIGFRNQLLWYINEFGCRPDDHL